MGENINTIDIARIEQFLSYGSIFIWDKSSLCSTGFKKCVQSLFSVIQKHSSSFIVPAFVKDELMHPDGPAALMVLDKHLFYVYPNVSNYHDLMRDLKERSITKINVFVNDYEIRESILETGKKYEITPYFYKITDNGEIEIFKINVKNIEKMVNAIGEKQSHDLNNQGNYYTRKTNSGYVIKEQPERVPFETINVNTEISIGSIVFDSDGSSLKVVKQEIKNNNAVTFSTDRVGIWVKIFDKKALNTYLEAKIQRMVSKRVNFEGICWPLDIVKDSEGHFRGYSLEPFQGVPLHLCIFKRAGIDTFFPNWSKIDLCELTNTILKKIDFLHKKNILFGCINPAAIRIIDKNKVFFTDTDNYQIDGFPTMIHNISFTAPELLDKKVYLATKANENFAIAELVFMMMMPGITPYAVGGDEAPVEQIKKMIFPYASGEVHGDKALPGMWRFMWSHLSSLKGCFYNVFQSGAKYSNPKDRKDVIYWESAIGHFIKDLQETEDKESLKIYPKSFKRGTGVPFYKCNYCGIEHPKFYFNAQYFDNFRICNSCIDKRSDVYFTCKACGRTYYYTNRTALFHKTKKMQDSEWRDQKYCSDCKKKTIPCVSCEKETPYYYLKNGRCPDCSKEYLSSTYKMITCRDCRKQFEFSIKDHEFYVSKRLSEPVRCPECRERKRNGNTDTYGNGSEKPKKKGGLFGWLRN